MPTCQEKSKGVIDGPCNAGWTSAFLSGFWLRALPLSPFMHTSAIKDDLWFVRSLLAIGLRSHIRAGDWFHFAPKTSWTELACSLCSYINNSPLDLRLFLWTRLLCLKGASRSLCIGDFIRKPVPCDAFFMVVSSVLDGWGCIGTPCRRTWNLRWLKFPFFPPLPLAFLRAALVSWLRVTHDGRPALESFTPGVKEKTEANLFAQLL